MKGRYLMLTNQRGAALVIALLVMVAATVVAICANFTSTTELAISGNQRRYCDAFYTADGGLEYMKTYLLNNWGLFSTIRGQGQTGMTMDDLLVAVPDVVPVTIDTASTQIVNSNDGPPPRQHGGTSAVNFRAYYYRVQSVVTVPTDIRLEEEFYVLGAAVQ